KEIQFFSHTGPVRSVVFHNNNTTVISGSVDKTAVVNTLALNRAIAAAEMPIRALATVANGTHVLTAADDKTVKLWNVGNGASERTFGGAEGAVNSVAVSKNTVLVAAGGADKQVRIYNFADAKLLTTLKTPAAVRGLAFNGTNQILAAVCEDKS